MSRLAALLLVLCGLALGACGGGEDEAASEPVAQQTTSATPEGEREIGDAVTADAEEGGAEEESPPDVGVLDDLPEEGVGSGQTTCAAPPTDVSGANLPAVRDALVCLTNAERTSRGLKPLKTNERLARAGTRKATDMVRRKYFAHDTPDGQKFTAMIKAAGYGKGARRWSVGENLAWGSGSLAAPEQIIEGWLASPGHRANMLSSKWNEVGIGIALGTPKGGQGATVASEFGKLG